MLDQKDDPEAYLTEDEFRRRKPHPNFKKQFQAEKYMIKYGRKGPINSYVIASGLVYHAGDSIFHDFFKVCDEYFHISSHHDTKPEYIGRVERKA
jgi:adenylate kinase